MGLGIGGEWVYVLLVSTPLKQTLHKEKRGQVVVGGVLWHLDAFLKRYVLVAWARSGKGVESPSSNVESKNGSHSPKTVKPGHV